MALSKEIARNQAFQATLVESEEKYRALVEGSPDAIFVQTRGCYAYLNAAALRLFGARSAEELLGQPVVERLHPDDRPRLRERIRLLNEEKKAVPNLDEKFLT